MNAPKQPPQRSMWADELDSPALLFLYVVVFLAFALGPAFVEGLSS